jgi:hypothetical protein
MKQRQARIARVDGRCSNELLHLIIEQPFAGFLHEFIVLQSGELSLSLSWTGRRLHELKVYGRGRGYRRSDHLRVPTLYPLL